MKKIFYIKFEFKVFKYLIVIFYKLRKRSDCFFIIMWYTCVDKLLFFRIHFLQDFMDSLQISKICRQQNSQRKVLTHIKGLTTSIPIPIKSFYVRPFDIHTIPIRIKHIHRGVKNFLNFLPSSTYFKRSFWRTPSEWTISSN